MIAAAWPLNSAAMRACVPQSMGERSPGGGGTCRPMTWKSRPMNPSGVQLARPIRPPGRVTRSSSAAARSWSGVNITPKEESATSKLPSGKGSASASAVSKTIDGRRSASARARPRSSRAGT